MVLENDNAVYITGLGHEYAEYSHSAEQFAHLVKKLLPESATSPGLQKLLQVNQNTKILSRPSIFDYSTWTKDDATPPNIDELSQIFRTTGVDLTVSACNKALSEAHTSTADITHTVAVTCTDQGNPGYDLLVTQKLFMSDNVQRTLLHGVGCAGGLSALRQAANLAAAASSRGLPARILVFATELCSLFMRAELQVACVDDTNLHIAPALFSDASAALVVCNGLALRNEQRPIFELQEWGSALIPGTRDHMSYLVNSCGPIATITKKVPKATIGAILPMFNKVCHQSGEPLYPALFDWAVHPGGLNILKGAQQAMGLTDDHIRASLDVYTRFGNSSSPTVLIVLDRLRSMGPGRDNVVATSFGPGLTIEMFRMRRCRDVGTHHTRKSGMMSTAHRLQISIARRLWRSRGRYPIAHRIGTVGEVHSTSLSNL